MLYLYRFNVKKIIATIIEQDWMLSKKVLLSSRKPNPAQSLHEIKFREKNWNKSSKAKDHLLFFLKKKTNLRGIRWGQVKLASVQFGEREGVMVTWHRVLGSTHSNEGITMAQHRKSVPKQAMRHAYECWRVGLGDKGEKTESSDCKLYT